MKTKKTPLTPIQIIRLLGILHEDRIVVSAQLVEIVDTKVMKIEIHWEDGSSESFYPPEEDMDFILNGIKLERNEEK